MRRRSTYHMLIEEVDYDSFFGRASHVLVSRCQAVANHRRRDASASGLRRAPANRNNPICRERGGRRADRRRPVLNAVAHCCDTAASRRTVQAAFLCAAQAGPHDPRAAFAYSGHSDRGRSASSSRTGRNARRAGSRGPPVSVCETDSRRRTLLRHHERLRTAPLGEQVDRTIILNRNIVNIRKEGAMESNFMASDEKIFQ
jgi:hypothetical protein